MLHKLGFVFLFLAGEIILTLGIVRVTGLSQELSAVFAIVIGILIYLMLDLRPEVDPNEDKLTRLNQGNWHKRM